MQLNYYFPPLSIPSPLLWVGFDNEFLIPSHQAQSPELHLIPTDHRHHLNLLPFVQHLWWFKRDISLSALSVHDGPVRHSLHIEVRGLVSRRYIRWLFSVWSIAVIIKEGSSLSHRRKIVLSSMEGIYTKTHLFRLHASEDPTISTLEDLAFVHVPSSATARTNRICSNICSKHRSRAEQCPQIIF